MIEDLTEVEKELVRYEKENEMLYDLVFALNEMMQKGAEKKKKRSKKESHEKQGVLFT